MTENEIINRLHLHGETMTQDEAFFIMDAFEEIQQYRELEKKLQSVYGEHDGLLEIVVNSLTQYENAPDKAIKAVLLTDDDVDKWEAYKAIGAVEEIKAKLKELDRWHTDKINENIKNPFAYTSTLCCHNCDHKDEYIEELEQELAELKKQPQGDLISRKSVQELIESKCTDGCLGTADTTLIDAYGLLDEVSELPTAYDVEKVVENLEKASTIYSLSERDCKFAIRQDIALYIVRNGGKE